MKPEAAIIHLRNYQAWRNGADIEQPRPQTVSVAIDTLIKFVETELAHRQKQQQA